MSATMNFGISLGTSCSNSLLYAFLGSDVGLYGFSYPCGTTMSTNEIGYISNHLETAFSKGVLSNNVRKTARNRDKLDGYMMAHVYQLEGTSVSFCI